MILTQDQTETLQKLQTGELNLQQFNTLRSAARRYRHLQKSIDYAVVYEIYKDRLKDDKGKEL